MTAIKGVILTVDKKISKIQQEIDKNTVTVFLLVVEVAAPRKLYTNRFCSFRDSVGHTYINP